jgi:CysZ protein
MILTDFGKAVVQLGDRRFRRVMLIGLLLSVALLVAAYAVLLYVVRTVDPSQIAFPVIGKISFLTDLLSWASAFFLFFLSMFLMVPVASAMTALFLDDVADAVEAEHYPHLLPAGRVSFYRGLVETVNFLGILIAANLLALALASVVPLAYPLVFWLMNGYLLGREYFLIAALRREGPVGARALLARNQGQIWLAGCLMALPLTVPLVNLVIPVLGAATFTHMYHRLNGTARG